MVKRTRRRKRTRRTRKQLRGGTTMPFSELGGLFSGLGSSFSNFMGTFTVSPSGYNPPNDSSVSKQFLMPPATSTLNQLYSSAYK